MFQEDDTGNLSTL
jgi:long-chain acyl-CoA synthetase